MSANVLGIDSSLTASGAARLHIDGWLETWEHQTDPLPADATLADVERRITGIARWILSRGTTATALAVIEAPSYGSDHGQPHERAGLWWATVRGLIRNGVPVASVAPRSLKAKIGGPNADKRTVRTALAQLYPGHGIHRISLDRSDALAAATLGVMKLAAARPADGWRGPWLNAQALNLDTGCRWPVELHPTPRDPLPTVASPFGATR